VLPLLGEACKLVLPFDVGALVRIAIVQHADPRVRLDALGR
jgi:hypothetical protein